MAEVILGKAKNLSISPSVDDYLGQMLPPSESRKQSRQQMRQHILNEIRRLAAAANGKAPGKMLFERETGIREHPWSGSLWARWSDAIVEAGLKKNALQTRFDTTDVLAKIVDACRYYGRIPSIAEMKLYRIQDRSFPSKSTIAGHFPTREKLIQALTQLAAGNDACSDIAEMLPTLDGRAPS